MVLVDVAIVQCGQNPRHLNEVPNVLLKNVIVLVTPYRKCSSLSFARVLQLCGGAACPTQPRTR